MKYQLFLLLPVLVFLHACSDPARAPTGSDSTQLQDLLNQLIAGSGTVDAPASPRLPDDLLLHPASQAEAVSFDAILTIAEQSSSIAPTRSAALMAQLERFALMPASTPQATGSSWNYTSVMRSRLVTDASVMNHQDDDAIDDAEATGLALFAELPARQSVQRMALDLAGASADRLWVGGDGVQLELTASIKGSCERTYQWESTLSAQTQLVLDFTLQSCPTFQSVGELNTWQHAGVEVSGQLVSAAPNSQAAPIAVSGYGWLRQSYGNLPALAEAAVLLDTLRLRLTDERLLDITRSKRRSGRGPRTVSARIQEPGGAWRDVSLEWEDSKEQRIAESGNAYPDSVRISSTALDEPIDIKVEPMNRLSESAEMSGSQLSVPVTADGSHTGAGFITLFALPPPVLSESDQVSSE